MEIIKNIYVLKNIEKVNNYNISNKTISLNKTNKITNINDKLLDSLEIQKQNIFKNKFKKNKVYVKGFNLKNIKKILINYYSKIICKYDNCKTCYNMNKYGKCYFKHINNFFKLEDYINNYNLQQIEK